MAYQIFTDATSDLTEELLPGVPSIKIIPMNVEIGGQNYLYGPGGNITARQFYDLQRQGNYATTSQINPDTYRQHFEPVLQQGTDILYLCFSSGLSSTIQSAHICIDELQQQYPERKILCLDTLAAALGEGLFVLEAAKKQAAGMSLDELYSWLSEHRLNICHWVTVDTFDHLKHGGRVSATTAVMGTMLNIKPLIHVDEIGKLVSVGKPRGQKKALQALVSNMEKGWSPEISNQVIVGHGDFPDVAEELKEMVTAKFPNADVRIAQIGPIIGAHTGPGVMTLFFWGTNR